MCHGLSWVGKDPIISTPLNLFLIKDKPAAAEKKEKGKNEAFDEGGLSLNPPRFVFAAKINSA